MHLIYKTLFSIFIASVAGNLAAQITPQIPVPEERLAPFYHGVASGDPLPDGVIIWTRITPNDYLPTENIPVSWEISSSADFTVIISAGEYFANAERDYTVKVDVRGLEPATHYYYRFIAPDGRLSLTGRTKTAPAGPSDNLRFGVMSCSSIFSGYMNAYRQVARMPDLDAIIHMGDYIYDFVDRDEEVRVPDPYPQTPTNKQEWRDRHSYYKLDPDFRAAHQQHPFIVTWDNHDIKWVGNTGEVTPSMEAFLEWVPIRPPRPETLSIIYRKISYGDLLDILIMDIDVFRVSPGGSSLDMRDDTTRSILGPEQYNWLVSELSQSTAQWRILSSQKIFSQWKAIGLSDLINIPGLPADGIAFNPNSWDGYPYERRKLLKFLRENGIHNNIFISGDSHLAMAMDVTENPYDRNIYRPNGPTNEYNVGVEFEPSSVSRGNLDETIPVPLPQFVYDVVQEVSKNLNPHHKYANFVDHGYGILDVRADSAVAEYWYTPILTSNDQKHMEAAYTVYDLANRWNRRVIRNPTVPVYAGAPLATSEPGEVTSSRPMQSRQKLFKVYPNPARAHLHLEWIQQHKVDATVKAFEASSGRMIWKGNLASADRSLTIDVSGWPAGAYIVVLETGKEASSEKVIIQ